MTFNVGDTVVDKWELRNNEDGAPCAVIEQTDREESGFWWYKVTFPGLTTQWYDEDELELVAE